MSFALIITILSAHGSAISSTSGFASMAACKAAGDAWLRSIDAEATYSYGLRRFAVCIPVRT